MDLIEGIKTLHVHISKRLPYHCMLWEMDLIEGIKTISSTIHIDFTITMLWEMDLIEGIKTRKTAILFWDPAIQVMRNGPDRRD